MAMDTPATIAILGAGPLGMEAGLYARYLGYDVIIFERHEVATNVLRWGHLRMFSPFADLRSPLGIAALRAQDPAYRSPEADAQLTGREWVDQYLLPLSRTDLLADHLVCGAAVQRVGRRHHLKTHGDTGQPRCEDEFRILIEHDDGTQSIQKADIVIDATGVFGQPNWLGTGGIPARGEQRLRSRIEYQVPDILGTQRPHYEAHSVLVVGSGLSAATTVVALAQIIERVPQTRVTWVTHAADCEPERGPIRLSPLDDLPQRRRLAEAANRCAAAGNPRLEHRPGVSIEAVDFDAAEAQFLVWFDTDEQPQLFDRIIANVGYRGDATLYEELQVRESIRTGGPWGVAARRDGEPATPSLDQPRHRADWLVTTEPHFYILGAKSYGRDSRFMMTVGYEQIRDLFSLIGDRVTLDLYATARE